MTTHAREIKRCRKDALFFRDRAAAAGEDNRLRDGYIGLAAEYDRLAELLVRIKPRIGGELA